MDGAFEFGFSVNSARHQPSGIDRYDNVLFAFDLILSGGQAGPSGRRCP